MNVWLAERDVGGYEYMLLDVFATQQAAEQFCHDHNAYFHVTDPEDDRYAAARQITVLTHSRHPDLDPLAWGTQ